MADQQQIHDSNTAINNAAKEALFVIKIGGNIIDDASKLNNFLKQFTDIQGKKNFGAWWWKTCYSVGKRFGYRTRNGGWKTYH